MAKTTYTVEIIYAGGQWKFPTTPPMTTVKHGDTVQWFCRNYPWTVFFKNSISPFDDQAGQPQMALNGAAGGQTSALGNDISNRTKRKVHYRWGASVMLGGGAQAQSPDPEIIIDDNPFVKGKRRRRRKKAARKPSAVKRVAKKRGGSAKKSRRKRMSARKK